MIYSIHLSLAWVFLAALGCTLVPALCRANTYYVDCTSHNAQTDGLSPITAWNTLSLVSGHHFLPGDAIRFRRGSACSGMLWPKGSGSPCAPIRVDAWGTGPLPKIQAEPGQEAAFRLFDQEYWTIEHLECAGGQPHGIFINGTKGVLHGIHIRDVIVDDVTGQPKNKEGGLLVIAPGSAEQRLDDVIVDGVTVYETSQGAGILVGGVKFGILPVKYMYCLFLSASGTLICI